MKRLLCLFAWVVTAAGFPARADEDVLPGGEVYVPCRVIQRAPIEFPPRLLTEGVLNGEAVVMLEIDPEGRLKDLLVVAYTHQPFADAVAEAARQWSFIPGYLGEQPLRSLLTLTVAFQISGTVPVARSLLSEKRMAAFNEKYVYRPASVARLDRPPRPVKNEAPLYLPEWADEGRSGRVVVEFFIDEEGRVRFVHVVGEGDELLGAAAVGAVQGWQFEPALHRKRRVLVRAQQEFHFGPRAEGTAPADPSR
jgi:TonB family protein